MESQRSVLGPDSDGNGMQVIWVDLLTKQEFEAGFGSHTPIYSGQTQCVRYYMNFERALGVFRTVLLAEGRAFDAHNVAGDPL